MIRIELRTEIENEIYETVIYAKKTKHTKNLIDNVLNEIYENSLVVKYSSKTTNFEIR